MIKKFPMIIVALMTAASFAATAGAQTQNPNQDPTSQPHQRPSVDEMAQKKADMMNQEIGLDEKQYKQVLKLFKSQIQKERDLMESNRPEGMPEGFPGGGPGMGGPGMGGPGMGGGRPPMGGPDSGKGFGGPEMGGGRPPMGGPGMKPDAEELEKLYEQEDKKLKKILTQEQYSQWRSKHPIPTAPMPEVDLKQD